MVRLELQPQRVGVGGEVRGALGAGEPADDQGVVGLAVLHRQRVVRRLQVEVVEGQVDAGARLRLDEPHAVHVVAVAFRVIRREDGAGGSREVGHAGDWKRGSRKRKTRGWRKSQRRRNQNSGWEEGADR